MKWEPSVAQAHLAERLGLQSTHAEALSGGLLNYVFRVFLKRGGSVIVKHAPPYVASRPELPLDPSRARFEAQALDWVGQRMDQRIGVPKLLDFHGSTLVLEDLGPCRDLEDIVRAGEGAALVKTLGEWLAGLHADPDAPDLHNLPVQQTRLALQYQSIGPLLTELGVPDAAELGARAEELGRRLLRKGDSFVMGDLWPPSVLVDQQGRPWIIDWELCTQGHPAQDLGHLAAHLWMVSLVAGHSASLAPDFLWAAGTRNSMERWADRDTCTHAACEVLLRSHGAFAGTGALEGVDPRSESAQRALDFALGLLRVQ